MNHAMFSAEFDKLCKSTKDKTLKVTEEIQRLCGVNNTALAISKESYIEMMKVFKVDPSEAKRKFNKAAETLNVSEIPQAPSTRKRQALIHLHTVLLRGLQPLLPLLHLSPLELSLIVIRWILLQGLHMHHK